MPNSIQSWEYSKGGGMEGILHIRAEPQWQPQRPVSLRGWWQGDSQLELARQQLEQQQPGSPPRNSLHFSPAFVGEFCFISCPFHPPRLRPISSSFIDSAIYFLLSNDFDSQRIISNILSVSSFRIARRTYGDFSCGDRKLAAAIASIISINNESIR